MTFRTPAFAIGAFFFVFIPGTAGLHAQGRGGRGRGNNLAKGTDITASRSFDQEAVDRGKTKFGMLCGFCHGADARGGAGKTEVDLVRSTLVLDDIGGKEIGEFLKTGRPEKKMPKFTLSDAEVSDIAAFLHYNVTVASERAAYKYLNVLVGDPKAGEAYFNGPGGCTACHSVTGDLKGIGAKYDPPTIQLRIVTGGGGGRGGRGRGNPKTEKAVTVTMPDGKTISGALGQITPFSVTVREESGASQPFPRDGDVPKVVVTDPLQAHLDLMRRYTDDDMHNLTAWLASLQ